MRKIVIFICYVLVSTSVVAQNYDFKAFTTKEGLVHNQVFAIMQAKNQTIWAATLNGVSCFNGTSFKNYTTKDGLPSNICMALFEDAKQNIWVGTINNGIAIISKDKVTVPTAIDFKKMGTITSFLEAKDGSIYIFGNRGMVHFKDDTYTVLYNNESLNSVFATNAAWYDDNTIYVASMNSGIKKITLHPFHFEVIDNKSHNINNICYSIVVDQEKKVWFGSYGALYCLADTKVEEFIPDKNDLNNNRVYTIFQENDTTLGLGFEGNGMAFFNKKTHTFDIINTNNGLPSNYIYGLIKDTEHNYWMGSFNNGIIRFRDKSKRLISTKQGLPSDIINDVVQWNNKLYVASEKGLVILNQEKVEKVLFPDTKILRMIKTAQNTLFVATEEKVLELKENGTMELIDEGTYTDIYKDKKITLLGYTDNMKIITKDSTYSIKTKKTFKIVPLGDRYLFAKLNGIYQFKDGKVDTIPGLHPSIYDIVNSIDGFTKNECIALNESYVLYVGLHNNRFKVKTFDLERFGSDYTALKVHDNNLWLVSKKELTKVDLKALLDRDTIISKRYKIGDNFIPNGVLWDGIQTSDDGTLLVCTLNGVFLFNEKQHVENKRAPTLALKDVVLFSESIKDKIENQSLQLPYTDNYLTFDMEAVSFSNSENIKYKFRLKGLRDGNVWSQPTNVNTAVFSYIPPGEYQFEFTADNGNGLWQSQPFVIPISIKNPFWRVWWFWLLLLLSFGFVVIVYLNQKNKIALRRQAQITQDILNAQEEERTRVALELHDSVGQQLMLLTRKSKNSKDAEIETLAKDTLQNVRTISQGLHPIVLERLGFTAGINDLIHTIDANTDFFFTVDIEDIDAYLDSQKALHLYRILQELLNNTIKHSEATSIAIEIHKINAKTIEVVLEDNGKGFDYEHQMKVSKSLGMKSLFERSKIINGKLNVVSTPKEGTIIQLLFPIS